MFVRAVALLVLIWGVSSAAHAEDVSSGGPDAWIRMRVEACQAHRQIQANERKRVENEAKLALLATGMAQKRAMRVGPFPEWMDEALPLDGRWYDIEWIRSRIPVLRAAAASEMTSADVARTIQIKRQRISVEVDLEMRARALREIDAARESAQAVAGSWHVPSGTLPHVDIDAPGPVRLALELVYEDARSWGYEGRFILEVFAGENLAWKLTGTWARNQLVGQEVTGAATDTKPRASFALAEKGSVLRVDSWLMRANFAEAWNAHYGNHVPTELEFRRAANNTNATKPVTELAVDHLVEMNAEYCRLLAVNLRLAEESRELREKQDLIRLTIEKEGGLLFPCVPDWMVPVLPDDGPWFDLAWLKAKHSELENKTWDAEGVDSLQSVVDSTRVSLMEYIQLREDANAQQTLGKKMAGTWNVDAEHQRRHLGVKLNGSVTASINLSVVGFSMRRLHGKFAYTLHVDGKPHDEKQGTWTLGKATKGGRVLRFLHQQTHRGATWDATWLAMIRESGELSVASGIFDTPELSLGRFFEDEALFRKP